MDNNDLFEIFGQIDDPISTDTEACRKRKSNPIVGILIAASLALVLLAFGIFFFSPEDDPDQVLSSPTATTAQDPEDLRLAASRYLATYEGFLSGPIETRSPDDPPLFRFTFWETYDGELRVDVSYGGKIADSKDEQIDVHHTYRSDDSHGYSVVGWFEETTDITVTIVDDSTGELVEELTVHVVPPEGDNEYELTVTNAKTNCPEIDW